jgi:hypothetical protein
VQQASSLGQFAGPAALGLWVEHLGWPAAPVIWHRRLCSGSPARSRSDAVSSPPNSEAAANGREQPASGVPVIEFIE